MLAPFTSDFWNLDRFHSIKYSIIKSTCQNKGNPKRFRNLGDTTLNVLDNKYDVTGITRNYTGLKENEMQCPHCLIAVYPSEEQYPLATDIDHFWKVHKYRCPNCEKFIITLVGYHKGNNVQKQISILAYPKTVSRTPLSKDVPDKFSNDYKEACLVFADSPKASAALSRRCLQHLLREKAGVKNSDLNDEIEQVLQSKQLPSSLAAAIDAVRNIGNFATHPIKSKHTGEVVDVEPGEAEWLLDVLEGLFDFYFINPAELQRKRDALNKKLVDVGKPPMK